MLRLLQYNISHFAPYPPILSFFPSPPLPPTSKPKKHETQKDIQQELANKVLETQDSMPMGSIDNQCSTQAGRVEFAEAECGSGPLACLGSLCTMTDHLVA